MIRDLLWEWKRRVKWLECRAPHFLSSVLILWHGKFHPAIFPRVWEGFQAQSLSQTVRFSKFFLSMITSDVLPGPGHSFLRVSKHWKISPPFSGEPLCKITLRSSLNGYFLCWQYSPWMQSLSEHIHYLFFSLDRLKLSGLFWMLLNKACIIVSNPSA